MKKLLLGLLTLATISTSLAYANGDILLSLGQSVTISGTTVTCVSSAPTTPASQCSRLKRMTSEEVYILGLRSGIGNCYIIDNNGHYGVMHSSRGQISPTYREPHAGRSSYDSNSYTASTGLVQLACSGQCLRP